ncbi:MAG TPA: glycosyltransferase family 39 protein [Acidimicrobiia bacterium]|nr:glycosyltransferase family 39 protein [Acidimicrobiia bacterium]
MTTPNEPRLRAPDPPAPSPTADAERRTFVRWLTIITIVGLAVRLAYVLLVRRDHVVGGDAFFYHVGANLLADGKGFIAPLPYVIGSTVQAADHPPLYIVFLAIPSVFGLRSSLDHILWSTLLGTGTIVMTGMLGRRVGGTRVGLVAAALAAVYPNIWLHDGALLSETLAIFVVTTALLLAYRAWEQPSLGRVVALGAACGVAMLSRSELVLLLPALLAPVVLLARAITVRERLLRLGAGTLVALVLVAPWIGYNLSRFSHPVYLSSQFEATIAGANCRDTYRGPSLGSTTSTCVKGIAPTKDESEAGIVLRDRAETFVRDNLGRVPVVVSARVGRILGLYPPGRLIDVEVFFEGRERWVATLELITFYPVAIGAVAGAVVLRRRRKAPLFPLLAVPAIVVVTVAVTYGSNRFRAPAETALVVLAAIAVDELWRRWRMRSSRPREGSLARAGV